MDTPFSPGARHSIAKLARQVGPAARAALIVGVLVGSASACPPPVQDAARKARPADGGVVDTSGVPEWMVRLAPDPGSAAGKAYAAQQKSRVAIERELKKLRADHFRTRNTPTRQIGIARLRGYADPAIFPSLLAIFAHEDRDVRGAILDHLADLKTDEADATLAWAAVHDDDAWLREQATLRVQSRVRETGAVSNRVKWAAAAGLGSKSERLIASGAAFARDLDMFDAIPTMINLQVGGGGASGGGGGGGGGVGIGAGDPGTSLAYIIVGTQQAFVSDLTPVVGDNAVAFDPTLSVVTEGVVLRVIDAVVITYRTEVHLALVALGNKGWDGRSTASLGWDQRKWHDWYAGEFQPYRQSVERIAKK